MTIPENNPRDSPAKERKHIELPSFCWVMLVMHLDIRFYLTKLLALNSKTRKFFGSLNSALLDLFILSYGLNHKLRRSNLAGT